MDPPSNITHVLWGTAADTRNLHVSRKRPDDLDEFDFLCWKFKLEPLSNNGTAVAHVTIDQCPTIPIYFIASERLSESELAARYAFALNLDLDEYIDFASCNMSAEVARELIRSRVCLT
jgi:hypothetical protein